MTFYLLARLRERTCAPCTDDFPSIRRAKQRIVAVLKTRMAFMLDERAVDHTPVFVLGAYLSPPLYKMLTPQERDLAERSAKIRVKTSEIERLDVFRNSP